MEKNYIYIGNLRDKKAFFHMTISNFLISVILAVVFFVISIESNFHFQYLIVPITFIILNIKILSGKTSMFYWIKLALKYLVFTQQEYKWGRKKGV